MISRRGASRLPAAVTPRLRESLLSVGEPVHRGRDRQQREHLRVARRSRSAPVRVVEADNSDIIDHLSLERDSAAVSGAVIQELRTLLGDLRKTAGDIRGYDNALRACHEALTELADGHDIGDTLSW